MKHLLTLLTILLFISCKKDVETTNVKVTTVTDTTAIDTSANFKSNVYIKDRSLYSKPFLAHLDETGYPSPLQIIGDRIFVEGDTISFPNELELNQAYKFTAFTDTHFYQLDITRTGLTTVEYDFTLFANEKPVLKHKGTAHLGGMFFLASEIDEDDESGEGYGATEYGEDYGNDCYFKIRIGDADDKNRLRATIGNYCDGKPVNEAVEIDVTLRESK